MSQNLECGSSMSYYHISEQKLCNDGWAKFFFKPYFIFECKGR